MCGLSAILLKNGTAVDGKVVARMTDVLAHRGPDDSGYFLAGPIGLGFRRLSILDLSPSGHQPMTLDGRATVVFNGEIYNFVELRKELTDLGHRFISTGDTEVLVRAYLEWGTDCVLRFNGMWAFVIHDMERQVLFGSRDRFGIKPLYMHANADCVLLASEIKSIRASGLYRGDTNWERAARFLLDGQIDETEETFYSGIRQIPPGTSFEISLDGECREWQYWTLANAVREVGSDPASEFADLFEDAVRLHMRSDVPVGVHLSGGLDSTSIICASARLRRTASATDPLMAFSYIAKEFDESPYIAETVAQAGATLVKLETDPVRLWSLVAEVLRYQDEPIYSMMPLVGYELMRLTASSGVKVILNGQGADETLGGYPSYFENYWLTLFRRGQVRHTWREIGSYVSSHGGSRARLFLGQLLRLTRATAGRTSAYRKAAEWNRRRKRLAHPWFTNDFCSQLRDGNEAHTAKDLDDSLEYSIYRTPLPRILRVEDRNSMAHSIESRLPFLDYRLVSLAFSLPPDWRLRGPWNKFVLREAMRGRIPEKVRTRVDKMGFPVPANSWIAGPLCDPLLDVLTSRNARERGIYNVGAIVEAVEKQRRGETRLGTALFNIAQFEIWSTQ